MRIFFFPEEKRVPIRVNQQGITNKQILSKNLRLLTGYHLFTRTPLTDVQIDRLLKVLNRIEVMRDDQDISRDLTIEEVVRNSFL